jgi:hypothetical protein
MVKVKEKSGLGGAKLGRSFYPVRVLHVVSAKVSFFCLIRSLSDSASCRAVAMRSAILSSFRFMVCGFKSKVGIYSEGLDEWKE